MHLPRARRRVWPALLSVALLALVGSVAYAVSGGGIPYFLRIGTVTSTSTTAIDAATEVRLNGGNQAQIVQRNQGAGTDLKTYDSYVDTTGVLHYRLLNDANNNSNDWMTVTRTGFASAVVSIPGLSGTAYAAQISVSGTCSIFAQKPSGWITGCTYNAAGNTTLTSAAVFGAHNVACTVTPSGASYHVAYHAAPSGSTLQVLTASSQTPTLSDVSYDIICVPVS
jgi:hypothetical protein